jgi:isocitrate dehydrogenase (NAD+)
MSSSRLVTLIPGDGIGPEITDAVTRILEAAGAPFTWDVQLGGVAAMDKHGEPMPKATIDSIRKTGLALKGPLATPIGTGFRSVNVALRAEFGLYANVRPARTIVPDRFEDVDIILLRENLEGFYVGLEHYVRVGDDPHGMAIAQGINTKEGARRIIKYAFDLAVKQGRKHVTVVHKANILKMLTGIFLETAAEVAKEYEGKVTWDDRIVDAAAMLLVQDPTKFDVIVTTNMFGDILSDLIAGLVGGLGLAPGGNIGKDAAIFEAVHGSAPDIAGKGVANPTAMLLAGAMLLDHVGEQATATKVRNAVLTALNSGAKTRDLGGTASTKEYADAVIAALK